MLPTKFGVSWPFCSGYEVKNRFESHLGFPIGKILAIFDLQVSPMLPTKFQVDWHLGFGEEAKNRFSRWLPWRPSWIYNQHNFNYFCSTSHSYSSYQVSTSRILAIFDLQVTLMLPSKFGVSWPFGSGEEAKNRFSRWRPWQPSWISNRNDFSYFWSASHLDASYQVSSQLAQGCRLLKQLLTPHAAWRTLTDYNSSPWALRSIPTQKKPHTHFLHYILVVPVFLVVSVNLFAQKTSKRGDKSWVKVPIYQPLVIKSEYPGK